MELSFLALLLVGFLVVALLVTLYLVLKGRRLDKEIMEKQKFLEENPSPKNVHGIREFFLHDN